MISCDLKMFFKTNKCIIIGVSMKAFTMQSKNKIGAWAHIKPPFGVFMSTIVTYCHNKLHPDFHLLCILEFRSETILIMYGSCKSFVKYFKYPVICNTHFWLYNCKSFQNSSSGH